MSVVLAGLDSAWAFLQQDAAFLVAGAAMFTAVYSAWATRRHNRLSVKPYLTIAHWASEGEEKWGLVLSNDGLGPAFIRSYRFYIDGTELRQDPGNRAADVAARLGQPTVNWEYSEPIGAIKPGDEFFLVAAPRDAFLPDTFYTVLKRIRIQMTYASVYGQRVKRDFVLQKEEQRKRLPGSRRPSIQG